MKEYQHQLRLIKKILRENPKGLTVGQVAEELGINRNSAAKYLDILLISGQCELRKVGPAKLFVPSHRIPAATLIDHSSDAVILLDSKGKIIQFNKNTKQILNAKEEHISKYYQETTLYDYLKELNGDIQAGYEGISTTKEIHPHNKHLKAKIIPASFEDGEAGVTIIIEDVTKEVEMQRELENYFMLSIDLFSIEDFNGNFIKLNKAWEREFGWTVEEMLQKHRDYFRHPDDQRAADLAIESLKQGKELVNFTNRYRTKSGKYKRLQWSARAVPEQNRIYAVARVIKEEQNKNTKNP